VTHFEASKKDKGGGVGKGGERRERRKKTIKYRKYDMSWVT